VRAAADLKGLLNMHEPRASLSSLKIAPADRYQRRSGSWLAITVAGVLCAVGGWYWTTRPAVAAVRVARVGVATAESGQDVVLNGAGYVTARRRATVSAKITGKVTEVFVEEGQAVREGQILARLDPTQANAALAYAEAQLAAARKAMAEDTARLREAEVNLSRQQQLATAQLVGQAVLDSMQANVDALRARIAYATEQVSVAEAQVALRRADLDDTIVRAPFGGVAISKDAQPGEMISPISAGGGFTRTGICTIVDMASLEIEVDLNEGYITRVSERQPVEAVLHAYPDWRIPAHVVAVVPTADRQKATVKARIAFDRLDARILPDMGVKVSFRDSASRKPAAASEGPRLVMPKAAARAEGSGSIVFVVRGGRVERRAVTLGSERGGDVEVLSGLADGERVIVDGPITLRDGDAVEIV
jgi:RND family efflux transporter MFP subunit